MSLQTVIYSQACESKPPEDKTEHSLNRQVVFIWRLRGYYVLFYQAGFIEVWPLFTGWSLFGIGL